MRRLVSLVLVLVVAAPTVVGQPAASAGSAAAVTSPVIVELVDLEVPGDAALLAGVLDHENEGIEITTVLEDLDLMAADVTADGREALEGSDSVESVRPARTDLRLLLDESTVTVGATALHDVGLTGEGRTVAVIDSGVDADHPALAGSIVEQACLLDGAPAASELCANGTTNDTSAAPCVAILAACTHGTAVAGVITSDGGDTDADSALIGVAPGAGVIAVRVTAVVDGEAFIPEAGVLEALEYVYSLRDAYDIAAVNLSLGGDPGNCRDTAWEDVIGRLIGAGIAVVAASGNSGWHDAVAFPACLPDVISVGATTRGGAVAGFTNSSADLDLLAPGSPVESTVTEMFDPDGFADQVGTSFAAPHVAAALALVDEVLPSSWPVSRRHNLLRVSGDMVPRATSSPFDHDPRFPELRLEPVNAFEPFSDATNGFWVESADWAKISGVSTGIGGNTFGPVLPLTRAQAVTFLWRFMGSPDPAADSGFRDVGEGSWYAAAVAWAASVGVTTGTTPTTFSPDEVVSRAQLAAFMWRTVGKPAASAPAGFDDVGSSRYFTQAVDWMAEHGITTGTTPTSYSPDATVTRAQMVTFEYRLADADLAWVGSVAPPELALF